MVTILFFMGESKIMTNFLSFLCQAITVREEIQIEIVASSCDSLLLAPRVRAVIECVFDCLRPRDNTTDAQTRSCHRERVAIADYPRVSALLPTSGGQEMIKVKKQSLDSQDKWKHMI